ncbi:hypothetical protein ABEB36_003032 [Hypothenemus hampei]
MAELESVKKSMVERIFSITEAICENSKQTIQSNMKNSSTLSQKNVVNKELLKNCFETTITELKNDYLNSTNTARPITETLKNFKSLLTEQIGELTTEQQFLQTSIETLQRDLVVNIEFSDDELS